MSLVTGILASGIPSELFLVREVRMIDLQSMGEGQGLLSCRFAALNSCCLAALLPHYIHHHHFFLHSCLDTRNYSCNETSLACIFLGSVGHCYKSKL